MRHGHIVHGPQPLQITARPVQSGSLFEGQAADSWPSGRMTLWTASALLGMAVVGNKGGGRLSKAASNV